MTIEVLRERIAALEQRVKDGELALAEVRATVRELEAMLGRQNARIAELKGEEL